MYYVYRHIRLDKNEPFYIGIGKIVKDFPYKRAHNKLNRSKFWKAVVAKTEYEVEILFESDDQEEIKQKEIEFIALYGRREYGEGTLVNLSAGGEGFNGLTGHLHPMFGKEVSKETRAKQRKAKLGRQLSPETIAKLIPKRIGNKSRTGQKNSEETKRKMREAHSKYNVWSGRKHSEETKAKLKAARNKRPPMSEETKAKISMALKGQKKAPHVISIFTKAGVVARQRKAPLNRN